MSRLNRNIGKKQERRLKLRMGFIQANKEDFERFVNITGKDRLVIGPGENKELSLFCSKMRRELKYSLTTAKCDIWYNNYRLYLEMKEQKLI